MHCGLVMLGAPSAGDGGGLTALGVTEALLARGHRVTACLLLPVRPQDDPQSARGIARLQALGAEVATYIVPGLQRVRQPETIRSFALKAANEIRALCRPRHSDFYPLFTHAAAIGRWIDAFRPDVIFAYYIGMEGAALARAPKMAAIGGLQHLVSYYNLWYRIPWRLSLRSLHSLARAWVGYRAFQRFDAETLTHYDRIGCFAAHDTAWLAAHGIPGAVYLPTPVRDPIGTAWPARRDQSASGGLPKILMVGTLNGLPTIAGLCFFARHVLPRLDRLLGPRHFEVHIVGARDPSLRSLPTGVERRLAAHPAVRFRGFVEDIDAELLSADVLLVPTPINFANRVRINVGFAYGCCVVAHRMDAQGLPELVDGENVLIGADGDTLARAVVRAVQDPQLRMHLQRGARRTYEACYSLEAAGGRIAEALEQLAGSARGNGLAQPAGFSQGAA